MHPTDEQINAALAMIQRNPETAAFLYAQAMNRLNVAEKALAAVRCLSQNPEIVTKGTPDQIGFAFGRSIS